MRFPIMLRRTHDRILASLRGDLGIAGATITNKDDHIRYLGRLVNDIQQRETNRRRSAAVHHRKYKPIGEAFPCPHAR